MAEPTTSGAAGYAGWKLIGGLAGAAGLGAAAAAVVVMCTTLPRTTREWAVALISTVMSSLGLGAFAILKLDMIGTVLRSGSDVELVITLMGMLGIVFACGLPGWALVRWAFNWMGKRADKDLGEVAREAVAEVREVIKP